MPLKVLFYAVNGLGLGHVTRLLAIARGIRTMRPDAQILFLTSSESDVVFREGFPAVKVPSKNIARDSGLSIPAHIGILHQTAWAVFSSFRPHVTVVDTFPYGFAHELDQVLRWESSKFVYVYRQRRNDKTTDAYFRSLLGRYDLILVPHEKGAPGVFIPEGVRTVFTGTVVIRGRGEIPSAARVMSEYGLPVDRRRVLVNLGGGGQEDLPAIIERIVDGLSRVDGIHVSVAKGGLLSRVARGNGTLVIDNYFPVCELYNAFDAVIAGCGYNTVNELLHFRKPGIYIPFERVVDDQLRRGRECRDAGFGLLADVRKLDAIPAIVKRLFADTVYARIVSNLRKANIPNNALKAARAIVRCSGVR